MNHTMGDLYQAVSEDRSSEICFSCSKSNSACDWITDNLEVLACLQASRAASQAFRRDCSGECEGEGDGCTMGGAGFKSSGGME